jgi:DNA-binding response OmpR family regulator
MNAGSMARSRVLIVDDEPDLLEGLKMMLEIKGIDVIIHSSMITLPLIMRQVAPDVVLLDISLPALSGTSALRSGLRKLLRTDGAILLFSGRSHRELTGMVQELGADGCITKADDPTEIVGRIQLWIDRSRLKRATERSEGSHAADRTAFAVAR